MPPSSILQTFRDLDVGETYTDSVVVADPAPKGIAAARRKITQRFAQALDKARAGGLSIEISTPAYIDPRNRVVVLFIAERTA